MRALKYAIVEASASLWRDRQAAALAVATIGAGIFLLGVFLLLDANLERLVDRWTQSAEMSVYLADDAGDGTRARLEATLAASPLVDRYQFISKSDALERFRRDFADLASLANGLEENPLPAGFDVRLRSVAGAEAEIDVLAKQLEASDGVADVRYDRLWVSRLLSAVVLLRGVSIAIITIVGIAAALTVANVVRLAAYWRRDEIEIMELVGSPAAYIRGPFVMEGVMQGGIGAVIAVALLRGGFAAASARYGVMVAEALGFDRLTFFPPLTTVLLILGGMAVGCLGGAVAARGVR